MLHDGRGGCTSNTVVSNGVTGYAEVREAMLVGGAAGCAEVPSGEKVAQATNKGMPDDKEGGHRGLIKNNLTKMRMKMPMKQPR